MIVLASFLTFLAFCFLLPNSVVSLSSARNLCICFLNPQHVMLIAQTCECIRKDAALAFVCTTDLESFCVNSSTTRSLRRIIDGSQRRAVSALPGLQSGQSSQKTVRSAASGLIAMKYWLVPTIVTAGLLLGITTFLMPRGGVFILLLLFVLVAWRWAWTEITVHELAAHLSRGETLNKLEVSHGAWGRLCHAVNNLVQQQRLFQRSRDLLPSLPEEMLNGLLEGAISTGQTTQVATVLLVGCQPSQNATAREIAEEWKSFAQLAQKAAAPHGALVQRCGDQLLLVFGLGRQSMTTPGLRSALETMRSLRSSSYYNTLSMALSAGPLLAGAIDGLGYGVIGQPLTRAQHLLGRLENYAAYDLLCDEECYVGLRQLGVDVRPLYDFDGSTLYGVQLD